PDDDQTSTLCAHPSSCSLQYVATTSGVIHVPSARSSPQASITRSNARSTVTVNVRLLSILRVLRFHSGGDSSGKIARGFGDTHGTNRLDTGQGKTPLR